MLFILFKSSITSAIMCGANTLDIIACDLVYAKENLGLQMFFISSDKQSFA